VAVLEAINRHHHSRKGKFAPSYAQEWGLEQLEPVYLNVATTVRATGRSSQRAQAHEDLVISLQPNQLEFETEAFVKPYR
jgi:hypothetical protein